MKLYMFSCFRILVVCVYYFVVVKSSLYSKSIMKRDCHKRHIIFIMYGNYQSFMFLKFL